jgi:hypothetical protein
VLQLFTFGNRLGGLSVNNGKTLIAFRYSLYCFAIFAAAYSPRNLHSNHLNVT